MIVRRERPHPGAQLSLFDTVEFSPGVDRGFDEVADRDHGPPSRHS
jgi:hypothetical protein